MSRTVNCKKLNQELEGLGKPPFEGELGQEIYENISKQAWETWEKDMMIKVINEYRLNLAEKDHFDQLMNQMKAFLSLNSDQVLEVENPERGSST